MGGGSKLVQRRGGEEFVDPLFVKAISHSLRVEIIVECTLAPTSESEFRTRRRGKRLSRQAVEHHFAVLLECGAIEEVHSVPERGGLTRFYGASKGALFSEEDFNSLPPSLKGNLSATVVNTLMERIKESLLAGTLDSHPERHLTWKPMRFDWIGFLEFVGKLDSLFYSLPAIQQEVDERLEASGEQPMHVTVSMMCFESPPPDRQNLLDPIEGQS